jgi:hypothetical protein
MSCLPRRDSVVRSDGLDPTPSLRALRFDLRGARISVEATAPRLEQSIDDICKAEIADYRMGRALDAHCRRCRRRLRSTARQPVGVGAHPLLRAARARGGRWACRRCRPTPSTLAAGGRDGLIGRFVDFVDGRQGSPRSAEAQPPSVDLTTLLAAYGRGVGRGSGSKRRGAGVVPGKSLAA